jgi:mannose-6-phosphate isomerase-like protein (cupin superfamily)
MQHPDEARVILTRLEGDGTSDYDELVVDTHVERDDSGIPVFKVSQLWGTNDGIGSVGAGLNPQQVSDPWFPGPGGIRFRFFTFMPTPKSANEADHAPSLLENAQGSGLSDFVQAFDPERPGMHISDTIDFVHILSGQVVLELERREILVKQGDLVIMRGGWHNWRNETDQPCTVASVMVGAHRE